MGSLRRWPPAPGYNGATMQKHHNFLVGALALAALVAIVVPAAAATVNRADVIGAADQIVTTLNTLIADQGDIADRVEKLKVAGSTKEQLAIAADARELKAKLQNIQGAVTDLQDKINSLKLNRASTKPIDEATQLQASCKISSARPRVGDTVTYEAVINAGSSKGATYKWGGDFSGVNKAESFYFTSAGSFNAYVVVKNQKGESYNAACPQVVVAPGAPGAGQGVTRATGAAITVIGPADGATLKIGTQANISWKHRGLNSSERLNISLRGAAGTSYFIKTSQAQGDNGAGSYVWADVGTAPNAFVPAGSYVMQVCTDDGVICGVSSVTVSAK